MSHDSQVIAEIPHDILGSSGEILPSDVYGVVGTQRRKRAELALAIDHQGVNIYDVRQSRLVSCYAVAPQASFTCPPYSLRYRPANGAPANRRTFCSLKLPNPRLYRFYETLTPNSSLENQIATRFVDLEEKHSPVIHLETKSGLAHDGTRTSIESLLAIHQNGEMICYSEDLETKLWSSSTFAGEGQQVLLASLTDAAQAGRGLLKHRADVLASLGQIDLDQPKDLLVRLISSKDLQGATEAPKLSLEMLDISEPNASSDGPGFQPRKVYSIEVPHTDHHKLEDSVFTIHLASGFLYQQTPDSVLVFDMTDLLPKIIHEVAVGQGDLSSFLRLSLQSLAVSRQSSLSVVSLPFCSIQGETKADRDPADGDTVLRLASYFDSLKTIVAIKGRSLIAMQLPRPNPGTVVPRKRRQEGTLAESVGRGSFAKRSLPFFDEPSNLSIRNLGTLSVVSEDDAWENLKAKWAGMPASGLKEMLNAVIKESEAHNSKGTSSANQRKVSYLLGRIFSVQRPTSSKDGEPNDRLHLTINCPNQNKVFKWLSRKGHLTKHRVEDSLRQNGNLHAFESLPATAIIEALSREDDSLQLLNLVLSSQIPLDSIELVSAIFIVIQSHHASGTSEAESSFSKHHNLNDLNTPLPTSTYQDLIHHILTRLSTLPSSAVTSALRSHLSTPNLLSLIDALRLQIATAGWFTPYDNDPAVPNPVTSNSHLAQITHLLNSTIDAIGSGGWILGAPSVSSRIVKSSSNSETRDNGDDDGEEEDAIAQTANTLSHMKAEVAAALEGIQEAVYLQGMLREVLLCGKDALAKAEHQAQLNNHSKKNKKNKNQEIIVTPAVADKSVAIGHALPLGLKLAKAVSKTVVAGGGELRERTRRGIGREKSRMVGVYSFERMRF